MRQKNEIKCRRGVAAQRWISSTLDVLEGGGSVFVPLSKQDPDFNHEILKELRDNTIYRIVMIPQYKEMICIKPSQQKLTGYKYFMQK